MARQGGADVGEAVPAAERHPGAARRVAQDRHIFARVIAARKRRVVAVVGRDDQQVARVQARQQFGQTRV